MVTKIFSPALIFLIAVVIKFAPSGMLNKHYIERGFDSAQQVAATEPDLFHNEPQYDSGWVSINKDQDKTFQHNIGGDPDRYVVDLQFYETSFEGYGINQDNYGGEEYLDFIGHANPIMVQKGAYWYGLTNKEVKVKRQADDGTQRVLRLLR